MGMGDLMSCQDNSTNSEAGRLRSASCGFVKDLPSSGDRNPLGPRLRPSKMIDLVL